MNYFLEGLLKRKIDVVDLKSDTLDIFIKINILNTGKSIYTIDNNNYLNKYMNDYHFDSIVNVAVGFLSEK